VNPLNRRVPLAPRRFVIAVQNDVVRSLVPAAGGEPLTLAQTMGRREPVR